MPDYQPLRDAIIEGNATAACRVTQQALADHADSFALVHDYMIPAMDEVGRRFESSEFFVPELLLSARAMKSAMKLVRPLLARSGREPAGRIVVGTVSGDLHDIGKNLVAILLEGGGFEVTDLGVNVSPTQFIAAAQAHSADIICLSALLTTTMMAMKTTMEALQEAGLRDRVKVLIGGAPITRKFADRIGADGYGANAVEAVVLAKQVLAQAG